MSRESLSTALLQWKLVGAPRKVSRFNERSLNVRINRTMRDGHPMAILVEP